MDNANGGLTVRAGRSGSAREPFPEVRCWASAEELI